MRFDLSDDERALLEPLMPKSRSSARADDRKIMNAIFYVCARASRFRADDTCQLPPRVERVPR